MKYQLGDYNNQLRTLELNIQKNDDEKENIIKWHINLQFDKIINKIKSNECKQDFYTFEIAYGSYLVGIDDFKKTYLILKTIFERNKNDTDENKINRFLSKFNQKRLYNLISGYYWLDDREDILSDLRNIDLDKYIAELDFQDKDIRKAIIEIKEDKLFNTSNSKVTEYYENIKKTFKLYESGGTQIGPYYPGLQWNDLALHYTSITSNFIFSDIFTNFRSFYQKIFESFIISFATDDTYQGKLKKFDYYHIALAFLYISSDKTKKLFNEYRIEKIIIDKTDSDKLLQIIQNYLTCNHQEGKKTFFGNISQNRVFTNHLASNYSFRENYLSIFDNIFLLLSKIDFNHDKTNEIIKNLINFLKFDNEINWVNLEYLALFVESIDNKSDLKLLEELLETIIEHTIRRNNTNIHASIIQAVTDKIEYINKNYEYNNYHLIEKILLFFAKGSHFQYSYADILISFWQISNQQSKMRIRDKFIDILSTKFEPTIFTKLVYNKIINIEFEDFFDQYINQYINYTKPHVEKRKKTTYLRI